MATTKRQQLPQIYTLAQIEAVTSSPEFATRLIDAVKNGFESYSHGEFNACPIQTMGTPPMAPFAVGSRGDEEGGDGNGDGEYSAQTCVKSGYVTGASHYVVKVASGGRPFSNSGSMQLYSQRTGRLEAVLLDEGLLTELRTAAAGAVASQILAPDLATAGCIGVLGTGVQARYQLRYLVHVTDCRNVKVWGRTKRRVREFVADMQSEGWSVNEVESPQHLLRDCSLVVTATSSREALLKSDGRRPRGGRPLHVTCIGSDAMGKTELDVRLVAAADLLVADSRVQTGERGEFARALELGLVSIKDVVEVGELVGRDGMHPERAREEDERFTIFDSSGIAVQDCVAAMMVYEALNESTRE